MRCGGACIRVGVTGVDDVSRMETSLSKQKVFPVPAVRLGFGLFTGTRKGHALSLECLR